ncbi:unnamed protein product [Toxocara canis]|uniref:ABC transporter permease n=1 Tax=Toxocara canis TaxID=6265 RepID=A0A183UGP4_TOXCA|nr:unnamed protein product [Toxocara canis]
MFRVVNSNPPETQSRGIISSIYNDPFNWSLFKGAIAFIVGVITARTHILTAARSGRFAEPVVLWQFAKGGSCFPDWFNLPFGKLLRVAVIGI